MKFFDRLKFFIILGVVALSSVALCLTPGKVFADDDSDEDETSYSLEAGVNAARGTGMQNSLPTTITNIVNTFLWIVGIVAVIVMIFGGFQYITSSGDAGKVTKAKNTILYGIVGLVVAVLAYAIVQFVIGQLGSSSSESEDEAYIITKTLA